MALSLKLKQEFPMHTVAAQLLMGEPAMGGFGAMPWREHILARLLGC
jgi:hypothetical protein